MLDGKGRTFAASLALAIFKATGPVRASRTALGANKATVVMSLCAANCSYDECLSRRYPV